MNNNTNKKEWATFGAGCFWCVEAVFQQIKGVSNVRSGYMGGDIKRPSYREICTGTTGHAEVCQINYDPSQVSYEELLEVFWFSHDPTTLNRQGNDKGTQYRSVIFYHTKNQKDTAFISKSNVAAKLWKDPIVTEITEASTFYEATDDHQNFYKENPNYGYCKVIIEPKVAKLRNKYYNKLI